MEQRLTLVTLGVADQARSVGFYERLGWTRSLRAAEGVAFFQLGGIGLALYPLADLAADAGLEQADLPAFRGTALAHNVREWEEVDRIVEAMVRAGGSLLREPEEKPWGGYVAYAADPDGHWWEVAWNPDFPLDQAGQVTIPG